MWHGEPGNFHYICFWTIDNFRLSKDMKSHSDICNNNIYIFLFSYLNNFLHKEDANYTGCNENIYRKLVL